MRVRSEHWDALLLFAEKHPELITNKTKGPSGRETMNNLWNSLANSLNSLGYGEKSTSDWKKALTDWKSKTKMKAARINRQRNQTGGGPVEAPPLSNKEERLIQLMGNIAVQGDEGVSEMGFGTVNVEYEEEIPHSEVQVAEDHEVQVAEEHDYHYATKEETSSSKKRSVQTKRKNKRLRPNKALEVSNKLVEMNQETLTVLQNINQNIEIVASSFKVLVEHMTK